MLIAVKLFAQLRETVGSDVATLDLPDGATIKMLRSRLSDQHPQVQALVARCLFSIDAEYASDADIIPPHAELACIPPVSGG